QWLPLQSFDRRWAWQGVYPDAPDVKLRIEAATFHNRPVYFELIHEWKIPTRDVAASFPPGIWVLFIILILLFFSVVIASGTLAYLNFKSGRSDGKGALRLAALVFFVRTFFWYVNCHHVAALSEFPIFIEAIKWGLLDGAIVWMIYIAL